MLRNIVAAMALLCIATPVQAGVFGSVLQNITNQRIEVSVDGGATWQTATVGVGAGFDLTEGSTSYTVTTYARLNAAEVENHSLSSTPDADIAYVSDQAGPGPANNSAFVANLPAGANPSYALSDADGSGRLGNTGDLETLLVSSTQIDTAGLSSQGSTNSDLSTSASISSLLTTNTAGLYRYVADYTLQMVRSFTAPGPANYSVTGDSTFIATLSRTGDSGPDDDANTPVALNVNLSGTTDYDEIIIGSITGPQLDFGKGDVVRFNIQSSTSVVAAAVPEPATVLSFLGIGAAGFAARRRRRRAAIAAV